MDDHHLETLPKADLPACSSRMKMLSLLSLSCVVLCQPAVCLRAQTEVGPLEFTVLVYNVENLFDLDGVSLFDEYALSRDRTSFPYGPVQMLNKFRAIESILREAGGAAGPEVIAFQEFELDQTPFLDGRGQAFARAWGGRTVEQVLESGNLAPEISAAPVELLLKRYLEEQGMGPYFVAVPDPLKSESHPPHKNAVFSKFPISYLRQYPTLEARDILEVGLRIGGSEVIVFNNHWKSGASKPSTERIRVQNARVLRARLDAVFFQDPGAEVVVVGDLNSHYNQRQVVPEITLSGINDVLGFTGDERRLQSDPGVDLYNLWLEVPREERGSDVWNGHWGTLLHILCSKGLYDVSGVHYIDNSFQRLRIPGVNVDRRWGQPKGWSNMGEGHGCSDHLPILARFRYTGATGSPAPMDLENPARERRLDDYRHPVDYASVRADELPVAEEILATATENEIGDLLGETFLVRAVVVDGPGTGVEVGRWRFGIYSPFREVRSRFGDLGVGETVEFIGELDTYRGNLQFVLHDPGWFRP